MNNEQINKLRSIIIDSINENEQYDKNDNNSHDLYSYVIDIILSLETLANDINDIESYEQIVALSHFIENKDKSEEQKQIEKGEAFEFFKPYDDDCFP
jgi:hypothetical protein